MWFGFTFVLGALLALLFFVSTCIGVLLLLDKLA
jgi:hypothetical protein